MVGINYPTYVNSYSGETAGNAVLAGIASCAANEAWQQTKKEPNPAPTQPVPQAQPSKEQNCWNPRNRIVGISATVCILILISRMNSTCASVSARQQTK
jgi:hypothetical protein